MSNKTITMVNHYGAQEKYLGFSRYPNWGKFLVEQGDSVYIICDGNIHNSNICLLTDEDDYRIIKDNGINYVYIRTHRYTGNGISRVLNLVSFYFSALRTIQKLPKADFVIAQTPNPLACLAALKYSKKLNIPCICDVVDLWPESIVVYNHMSRNNPVIAMLYKLEKWIYKKCDALIFSIPGGYQYIIDKGWESSVPKEKVFHINTGVDVGAFDRKKEKCTRNDYMDNLEKKFKVVYSGAVRLVNNLDILVKAGEIIHNKGFKDIIILIHGAGDYVEDLKEYCRKKNINNVKLFGRIKKDDIPYVLSNADLCILCYQNTPILRYGGSMNKLFDYFASGKPVVSNAKMNYSLIEQYQCGYELDSNDPNKMAECIIKFYEMSAQERYTFGINSRKAAEDFDIPKLGSKLLKVLEYAEAKKK